MDLTVGLCRFLLRNIFHAVCCVVAGVARSIHRVVFSFMSIAMRMKNLDGDQCFEELKQKSKNNPKIKKLQNKDAPSDIQTPVDPVTTELHSVFLLLC